MTLPKSNREKQIDLFLNQLESQKEYDYKKNLKVEELKKSYKNELEDYLEYGLKNGKSKLEWEEDIEILRFLEMSYPVKMIEVYGNTHAVDIPEDVKMVENILDE